MPFTWSHVKMKIISVVCLCFAISAQRMKECASSSDSLKEQYKCQVH